MVQFTFQLVSCIVRIVRSVLFQKTLKNDKLEVFNIMNRRRTRKLEEFQVPSTTKRQILNPVHIQDLKLCVILFVVVGEQWSKEAMVALLNQMSYLRQKINSTSYIWSSKNASIRTTICATCRLSFERRSSFEIPFLVKQSMSSIVTDKLHLLVSSNLEKKPLLLREQRQGVLSRVHMAWRQVMMQKIQKAEVGI